MATPRRTSAKKTSIEKATSDPNAVGDEIKASKIIPEAIPETRTTIPVENVVEAIPDDPIDIDPTENQLIKDAENEADALPAPILIPAESEPTPQPKTEEEIEEADRAFHIWRMQRPYADQEEVAAKFKEICGTP